MNITAGAYTHTGMVRQRNEDSHLCDLNGKVFLIADGMGGHEFGETASRLVVEQIADRFKPGANTPRGTLENASNLPDRVVRLVAALSEANSHIYQTLGNSGQRTAGSTAVATVAAEDMVFLVNVGDSRIYLVRDQTINQMTIDHTQVQEMVNAGLITPEQAREHPMSNVLTRAVGTGHRLAVDLFRFHPRYGDRLILCSDGLTKELPDEEILQRAYCDKNPSAVARRLVDEAVEKGGRDNVTAIVIVLENDRQETGDGQSDLHNLGTVYWLPDSRLTSRSHTTAPVIGTAATAEDAPEYPLMNGEPEGGQSDNPVPEAHTTGSPILLALAIGLLVLIAILIHAVNS